MPVSNLPENVRKFIFDFVDSVSFLEVLILVSKDKTRRWTADQLSAEMRSSLTAASHHIQKLVELKLGQHTDGAGFEFAPKDEQTAETVQQLIAEYQMRPHRVHELIFSPLKQARVISDGFRLSQPRKKEDENG